MRVLVADDDKDFASALSEMVRSIGYSPLPEVTSGGIDVLRACESHQPDVVLMDVLMPRCNGLTISNALRGKPNQPKVVFVSGALKDDNPCFENANVSAFLSKPVCSKQLEQVLSCLED